MMWNIKTTHAMILILSCLYPRVSQGSVYRNPWNIHHSFIVERRFTDVHHPTRPTRRFQTTLGFSKTILTHTTILSPLESFTTLRGGDLSYIEEEEEDSFMNDRDDEEDERDLSSIKDNVVEDGRNTMMSESNPYWTAQSEANSIIESFEKQLRQIRMEMEQEAFQELENIKRDILQHAQEEEEVSVREDSLYGKLAEGEDEEEYKKEEGQKVEDHATIQSIIGDDENINVSVKDDDESSSQTTMQEVTEPKDGIIPTEDISGIIDESTNDKQQEEEEELDETTSIKSVVEDSSSCHIGDEKVEDLHIDTVHEEKEEEQDNQEDSITASKALDSTTSPSVEEAKIRHVSDIQPEATVSSSPSTDIQPEATVSSSPSQLQGRRRSQRKRSGLNVITTDVDKKTKNKKQGKKKTKKQGKKKKIVPVVEDWSAVEKDLAADDTSVAVEEKERDETVLETLYEDEQPTNLATIIRENAIQLLVTLVLVVITHFLCRFVAQKLHLLPPG